MREQLVQYVNLLFAGAQDADEIRAEILQNTLDRYDDLVEQGKSPEAAYRLAISGIGDVNEILGTQPKAANVLSPSDPAHCEADELKRKRTRAAGIVLYILSAIPLIVLSNLGYDILGLALTIIMVAAATYNILITNKTEQDSPLPPEQDSPATPAQKLKKSVSSLTGALTLAIYLIVSFATGHWEVTWLIFPISGCIKGLINAIIDLKEACNHEN